jgi:alpha-tubulin suppressor-like RCC1 family protein
MCSGGQWLPWRSCDFEGECKPGDTRTNTNACPGLQTRTETCDTSCGWVAGACTGQFTRFVDLWSGARVNYAKASDGRIFGWGAGAGNLLSATDDLDATLPKVVAHAPAGIVEASIDAELPFRAFGCVLLGDGAVHCVGKNDRGQLGVATSITSRATFERVVTGASQVRAKAATACALRNGAVTCWGALRLTPSGSQFQQIALAPDFACLLASGGRVTCWGRSSPLAIPSATEPRTLVQSSDIVEITATTDNICGRRAKGTVACWGSASNGLLGTTETVDRSVLGPDVRATSGPGVLSDVVQLASGDQYVCALLSSGRVACWGDGIYGTLGTGSQSGNGPSLATGISNAKKIAAGDNHVCALLETGEIACWGVNLAGATGTGTAGGVTTAPHRIRI